MSQPVYYVEAQKDGAWQFEMRATDQAAAMRSAHFFEEIGRHVRVFERDGGVERTVYEYAPGLFTRNAPRPMSRR